MFVELLANIAENQPSFIRAHVEYDVKPISQMTREEKLQEIVEYNPCRIERNAVLRYLLAIHRNDTEQIAYFSCHLRYWFHIIYMLEG